MEITVHWLFGRGEMLRPVMSCSYCTHKKNAMDADGSRDSSEHRTGLFHVAVARWIARDKCRSPSWPSKQARRGCCSRIRNVFARREAGRDAALGGLDRD